MKSKELRVVRVTYDNGEVIETSMAAGLTDKEILAYYRIGRYFNVGFLSGEDDKMAKVIKVEILR